MPSLLTGDGAQAPMPGVLRLIDELCQAGAQNITRPACPRCHRVIRLDRRIDGQWLCRNCVARSQAQPCSRCGAVREAAARDEHGLPLCSNCLVADPANQESCAACGRRRRVSVRTPDKPLCDNCRPWQLLTCHICGKQAPCQVSEATGKPRCRSLQATLSEMRWLRRRPVRCAAALTSSLSAPAPLRHLAPAPPAAPPDREHRNHLHPDRRDPPPHQGCDHPARLVHHPWSHPGDRSPG